MQGTLQLFREQAQMDGIAKDIDVLKADGVPFEVLDRTGCVAAEPGLASSGVPMILGGLRLPNDETGDCLKFTEALAKLAEELGVRFQFDTDPAAPAARRRSQCHRRAHRAGEMRADIYLSRPGQLLAAAGAAAGTAAAGLSGEGLFDHRTDPRRRARRSRPCSTRPTRSRSRGWAIASASAAWPKYPATTTILPPARRDHPGAFGRHACFPAAAIWAPRAIGPACGR
jgi:hypothetical protein